MGSPEIATEPLDSPQRRGIHNHMVMRSERLDAVFRALSDPTRRGILEQLAAGETNVSTLAAPYDISQPAISKHLRVLERAGLIRRSVQGREHHIRVDPRPVEQAQGWIVRYAKFWQQQFDEVEAYLAQQKKRRKR